jgi:hypothetical protein
MDWAATADQYFAVAFLADTPQDMTLVTLNSPAEVPKNPAKPDEGKDKANVVGIAFGNASQPTRIRVFAGAKAVDLLESVQSHPGGPDLRGIYDFGTFSFIARPLFSLAQVDVRALDFQLGMGHRVSYRGNHHGAAASAHLQHEVITAHAEDPAADEGHPGKVQALQPYRPAARGDAEGNAGAVQEGRRQPGGRLLPIAAANAVSVCLLLHAE